MAKINEGNGKSFVLVGVVLFLVVVGMFAFLLNFRQGAPALTAPKVIVPARLEMEAEDMSHITGFSVFDGWGFNSSGKLYRSVEVPQKWASSGKNIEIALTARAVPVEKKPVVYYDTYLITSQETINSLMSAPNSDALSVSYRYTRDSSGNITTEARVATYTEFKKIIDSSVIKQSSRFVSDNGVIVNRSLVAVKDKAFTVKYLRRRPVNESWPRVKVMLDGVTVGEVGVDSLTWKQYNVVVPASSGKFDLALEFSNPYKRDGKSRHVYFDKVALMQEVEGAQYRR